MRRVFNIVIILTLLLSSCAFDISRAVNGKVYIVAVGIDYQNSFVSDLSGTVDDALEITECFKSIYESYGVDTDIRRMIQEGEDSDETDILYPSSENILRAIKDIDANPDDLLIFFYSGHGDVHRDENNMIQSSFLAAAKVGENGDRSLYTELDMDTLYETLEALPCPAVAIIDACYSGGTADNYKEPDFGESFTTMITGADLRGTAVIAASQPDELSYVSTVGTEEGTREPHSMLTISILRELGWSHTDKVSELVDANGKIRKVNGYLRELPSVMTVEELFEDVENSWGSPQQHPMMSKAPAGIFIIPAF